MEQKRKIAIRHVNQKMKRRRRNWRNFGIPKAVVFLLSTPKMDSVEDRKKRIEALKQKKAKLLAEGDVQTESQSSTRKYYFTKFINNCVEFDLEIILQQTVH